MASRILAQDTSDPGMKWYLVEFTAAGPDELSPTIHVPKLCTLKRIRWKGDTGTSLPRLLMEGAPSSTAAFTPVVEVCQPPGTAALDADRAVDIQIRAPDGKLIVQLQGTGTGRTVTMELFFFGSWRS